jgi:hypothetical protein
MGGTVLPLCAFNVMVEGDLNLYLYKFNRNVNPHSIMYSSYFRIFNKFKDEN